jgi:hypothetical protein
MTTGIHTAMRHGLVAWIATLLLAGCSDVPTSTGGPPESGGHQLLINGSDDFDRTAVAAIMVYDPNFVA